MRHMTSSGVRARSALPGDVQAVWRLVREFAVSFIPSEAVFRRSFAETLPRDDTLVLVAEPAGGGPVLGYALAAVHLTFFADAPVCWVEELMVDPDARQRGVGSALMAQIEHWAAEAGAAYVSLATRRAAAFYRAIGYEESAVFFRRLLGPGSPA